MMKRRDFVREARTLTTQTLADRVASGKKQLLELNQQKMLGKLKNYRAIKGLRREIARLRTVLDEKIQSQVER